MTRSAPSTTGYGLYRWPREVLQVMAYIVMATRSTTGYGLYSHGYAKYYRLAQHVTLHAAFDVALYFVLHVAAHGRVGQELHEIQGPVGS